MMLIGSQALSLILTDTLKLNSDYDVLITRKKFDETLSYYNNLQIKKLTSKSAIVLDTQENKVYDFLFVKQDTTDAYIIKSKPYTSIRTRIAVLNVISPELLKLVYESSYNVLKKKKYKDNMEALQNFILFDETEFLLQRNAETRRRKEESFFHKYPGLSEHIKHDDLHDLIAKKLGLPEPTYKKVIIDPVRGTINTWNELDLFDKITERVEETCVIYLERCWIPTCVKRKKIVPLYNKKAIQKTICHVNIRGLRDQGQYLTDFSNDAFATINEHVFIFLSGVDLCELEVMVQDIIDGKRESYYNENK